MAIAKKPSTNQKNIDLTDAIINKGGSSPSEQVYEENSNIKVTIRLTSKMLNIIDNYLENSISKNKVITLTWLAPTHRYQTFLFQF